MALSSFLVLFLELALIRWAGSEVIYLSYFTNLILLGSFLGIGIGFLLASSKRDLFAWTPAGLAVLALVVENSATRIPTEGAKLLYFGGSPGDTGLPAWVVLPAIFLAVATVMALAGQGLAKTFSRFESLEAYRLDILGALAGVASFGLLSLTGAPPIAWGGVVVVLFMVLAFPRVLIPLAGCAVIALVLARQSAAADTYYSPYFKIEIGQETDGGTPVMVDGILHQTVSPVSWLRGTSPAYLAPYEGVALPANVLIIGAGTGNDVAIALSEGALHVDAVEIDPRLQKLGEDLHPDQPYQDQRVDVHINDGRAFLEATDVKYDLILYALPDSLTLVTGQGGIRLESYLFTKEAVVSAKEHLTPGGTFAFYGYFPAAWMADRMAGALQEVFDRAPCVPGASTGTPTMLIEGPAPCSEPWAPSGTVVTATTDDRPFPYLKGADIPSFYFLALALILVVSVVSVLLTGGSLRAMKGFADLFFMGAAFLLLETKSVVQFALLFGTTWFVNALVFAGVLLVVLAGIEIARRLPLRKPTALYPALFIALGVAWLVPTSVLLSLPVPVRFLVAITLAFTPVLLANLVFSRRFRDVRSSTAAFAANLLGAVLGGLLEYGALVFGYRFLLIVAGALYLLAFAFGRRSLQAA